MKVWLERSGRVVLYDWRAAHPDPGTDSGPRPSDGVRGTSPQPSPWTRLREIEAGLGFKVLDTQIGGVEGGGSKLTPAARDVIDRFHRVADGVGGMVDARFHAEFPDGA